MTDIRRIITLRDVILSEMGRPLANPITRAIGLAVITNPFAGKFSEDLSPLFPVGRAIGERLSGDLRALLGGPAVAYGKAALVGINGEKEHGGACIHPMLGRPMREAIGGGKAVIPSNVKVAAVGASLDVPIGHKDDVWSFDHFDTVTVSVDDAPRADEIVIALVFADGGRPLPRCGKGPV
ncbi:MAG: amino acid synthesis family protein [Hyphomicrobium sp.]|nr:amino acid synthesis family protein [Hyphomicrobium sp.]